MAIEFSRPVSSFNGYFSTSENMAQAFGHIQIKKIMQSDWLKDFLTNASRTKFFQGIGFSQNFQNIYGESFKHRKHQQTNVFAKSKKSYVWGIFELSPYTRVFF